MALLLRRFVEIALLRRGPQDLPDSGFLLGMALLVYLLVNLVVTALYGTRLARLVLLVALDAALLVAWFWIVLAVSSRLHRFRQTATALLGTSALLTLLHVPLKLAYELLAQTDTAAALPLFGLSAILIWLIVAVAHIMQQALDTTPVVGVIIALAYTVTAVSASSTLAASLA